MPSLLDPDATLSPSAMMRAIQKRAMAGLEPTKAQQEWLQANAPRLEANGERLGAVGGALDPISGAFRAKDAIGEFARAPSIPNATDAGVKTAMAVFRPAAALKALGAGYGAAAATDSGLFGLLGQASAQQAKRSAPSQTNPNGYTDAELDGYAKQLGMPVDMLKGLSRSRVQNLIVQGAGAGISADAKRREAEAASQRAEYDASVNRAGMARDTELGRQRRFQDTTVGQVWEKTGGWGPFLVGAGLGGMSRAATGGGSALKNYGIPAALGGAGGVASNNIPLAYDAFMSPVENPERRAYEAYSRELPPTHPRRQEWQDYARSLPQENPVRTEAAKELYDPKKALERGIFGMVEGVGGALGGADAWRIMGRAAEGAAAMPGRIKGAYRQSMVKANEAEDMLRQFQAIKDKMAEAKGFGATAEAAEQALAAARARAEAAAAQPMPVVPPQPVAPPVQQIAPPVSADTPANRARRYLNTL